MLKKTIKLSGILCAIAFATALLLGLTNELTKDIIAQRQLQNKNNAMAKVIPAETYNLIVNNPGVFELYEAKTGEKVAGYAVSLSQSGYGGDIDMIIGIDSTGKVSGISITEMSETPGLGDNAKKPSFTDMFKGLEKNQVKLTNEGGKIQALSGATVTSRAVTKGVSRALEIVEKEIAGGAANEG